MTFKVTFNAPITLGFIGASIVILILNLIFPSLIPSFFSIGGSITIANPLDILRLFTHVLGNENFNQLFGNALLILLLGPILEDKYGAKTFLLIILVAAFVTGGINVLLFDTPLMGASSIVFTCIILASIVNVKSGALPLTFLLIVSIYVGRELIDIIGDGQFSQIAPIIGGLAGSGFGFWVKR